MMAEVKWIKITTDIFDDEKILMIETMPSADSIIVIWFKLLTFAGKQNNNGVFFMSNRIAYTDEMLAAIFRRDIKVVRLALKVFEQFGMIEIIDNVITIPNWGKHQTLDAYERKKERDRIYQQERRLKQKQLIQKSSDTSSDISTEASTYVAISDKDIDKDKEKDKDGRDMQIVGTEQYMNTPDDPPSPSTQKKPQKHKYGEYQNVLLSDDELKKLQDKYSDYQERIERLSEYIESKGVKYKSHYATINSWYRREQDEKKKSESTPRAYNGLTEADIHNLDGIL